MGCGLPEKFRAHAARPNDTDRQPVNLNTRKTMKKTILFLALSLSLVACGSYLTRAENVSKVKKSYSKVYVLFWSQNKIARGLFERDVAQALGEKGITAVRSLDSGIDIPTDQKISESDAAGLASQLRAQGFDGVVLTNLVDREEYKKEVPGRYSYGNYPAYSMHFGSYLGYYPAVSYEPGKQVTGTIFVLESTLYDLSSPKEENLQWIGWFELEDPEDIQKTTASYAHELVSALLKSNIHAPM
jgi:hypothetical protein